MSLRNTFIYMLKWKHESFITYRILAGISFEIKKDIICLIQITSIQRLKISQVWFKLSLQLILKIIIIFLFIVIFCKVVTSVLYLKYLMHGNLLLIQSILSTLTSWLSNFNCII